MIGETTFQATARFENGEPKIKVTAFTGYGSRTASVSQDVTDEKLLADLSRLSEKAIKSVQEELRHQSITAAAESLVVATKRKEAI